MEETKKKKLGLASWIFIAMILGIVFGIVMYKAGQAAFV